MDYGQKKLCLVEGLEDFASSNFQSKEYTDLTIRCGDKEFYVHKLIVCLFSAFFAKACKPDSPFKEARTGIIELHEDDPADVKLLLDSFYSSYYDEHQHWSQAVYPDLPLVEASRLRDARLYAIAEKYQAPCAKLHAAEIFRTELDRETGYMKLSASGFVKLAKKVFESTPDSDRVFRNLVFRYAQRHLPTLMSWSHFQTEMEQVDGFFSGLARFQTFYALKMRMCPECGQPQKNRWTDDKMYRGGHMRMRCVDENCTGLHTVDEWNRPYDTFTGEADMRSDLAGGPPCKRLRRDSNDMLDVHQYIRDLGPSTTDEEDNALDALNASTA